MGKKPPKKELENIEKGVKKAGIEAMKELYEGVTPEIKKLAERLDKLDIFLKKMITEDEELDPPSLTELLMVKARIVAFQNTEDTNPNNILVWLINIILFNADQVFSVLKAHLLDEQKKVKKKK